MIYHLFQYLESQGVDLPGMGLMHYLSFRAMASAVMAMLVALFAGNKIIDWLRAKQIGETVRDLGLADQVQKKGTPTMGGLIIILSILCGVLLFCDLSNIYVQLLLVSTLWCGGLGFADDYIKVFKHRKEGMSEKGKLAGQVVLGFIVGLTVWMSPNIVVREKVEVKESIERTLETETTVTSGRYVQEDVVKSTKTTLPFVKNHEFDYRWLSPVKGTWGWYCKWAIYVLMIVLVITACSNGTNLTDGLDGLAAGTSAVVLPQYHVYPGIGRASHLHERLCGIAHRLPLVQLLPGAGVHGRYRQSYHRRHHRRKRRPDAQGAAPSPAVRHLLRGERVRAPAKRLLPLYPQEDGHRQTHLEHGSAASSLPGQEGSGRACHLPQTRPRPARGKDYGTVHHRGNDPGCQYIGFVKD